MKVLHLSSFDTAGGAARGAYWQHQGLIELGVDSRMLVRFKGSIDLSITKVLPNQKTFPRIKRVLKRKYDESLKKRKLRKDRQSEFIMDESDLSTSDIQEQIAHADVINIHYCEGFLSIHGLLEMIPREKPVVITLHEMSFFTGGCNYAWDCRGFENECGLCPLMKSPQENDLSHSVWKSKHAALNKRKKENTYFVADSTWIESEGRKSKLLRDFNIRTIHYGINQDIFSPHDKLAVRKLLGINEAIPVILFASENISDPRKGFKLLFEAIKALPGQYPVQFISFGRVLDMSCMSHGVKHFGFVEDDRLMALLYSAADLFVIPSLQEAFGLTCLEAMACGTPVLGFDRGGIPDMVMHGFTGFSADKVSVDGLKQGLDDFLHNPLKYKEMGINSRQMTLDKFSREKNAENYSLLYRELFNQ